MKDAKFIEELKKHLAETNAVPEPQREDEFTVAWYAKEVAKCAHMKARRVLEGFVESGTVTVRRNVRIMWTVGSPRGCVGDVYKLEKSKKNERRL
jgi:hypothetical protein